MLLVQYYLVEYWIEGKHDNRPCMIQLHFDLSTTFEWMKSNHGKFHTMMICWVSLTSQLEPLKLRFRPRNKCWCTWLPEAYLSTHLISSIPPDLLLKLSSLLIWSILWICHYQCIVHISMKISGSRLLVYSGHSCYTRWYSFYCDHRTSSLNPSQMPSTRLSPSGQSRVKTYVATMDYSCLVFCIPHGSYRDSGDQCPSTCWLM